MSAKERVRSVGMLLCLTLPVGCGAYRRTVIDHVNLSNEQVVAFMTGVTPDVSPGVLVPGAGTEPLKRCSLYLARPVAFDDEITIS